MNTRMLRATIALIALSTGIVLAGCSGAAAPTASAPGDAMPSASTPTATGATSPRPSASTGIPTPDPETSTACERLVPLSVVHEAAGSNGAAWQQIRFADKPLVDRVEGPVAAAVAADATVSLTCGWAVPQTDGGATVTVATISDSDAQRLRSALDASAYKRTVSDDKKYEVYDLLDGGETLSGYGFGPGARGSCCQGVRVC